MIFKVSFDQNLVMINHTSNSDFKSHLLIGSTQNVFLALLDLKKFFHAGKKKKKISTIYFFVQIMIEFCLHVSKMICCYYYWWDRSKQRKHAKQSRQITGQTKLKLKLELGNRQPGQAKWQRRDLFRCPEGNSSVGSERVDAVNAASRTGCSDPLSYVVSWRSYLFWRLSS
jgi:hypothetical protein